MNPNLKKTIRAMVFCGLLLAAGSLFFFRTAHTSAAREDAFAVLLRLPAPPPPNPLAGGGPATRDEKFYKPGSPPGDNASTKDLLDYWERQSLGYAALTYIPEPSDVTKARIMKEIDRKPVLLPNYLNVFRNDLKAADQFKEHYDREGTTGVYDKETRKAIKAWLTYNSPYFSSDLAHIASAVTDNGEYVSSHEDLVALAHVDYDKAKPIIDKILADSSLKTSRVAATWAAYKHALDSNSIGDIDEYREALKKFVEDRSAVSGMRDLAMDALASEKEWPGRDEWYYSLMSDETLASLWVNGSQNTGLTTMVMTSPDGKYVDKMLELARSDNPTVRSNAVANLVTMLSNGNPEVIKALLPWLEDERWARDTGDSRGALLRRLAEVEMPESVLGLIKIVDEKRIGPAAMSNMSANAFANLPRYRDPNGASNSVANAANSMRTVSSMDTEVSYPFRYGAVAALAKQKDPRAVAPLRRVLNETTG
ncbi:MAG: hypothetical protein ABJB40_14535, partial [Acidobacteriota bacterium]